MTWPEIALKRDMVTVSCSGTIGRVQIIPAYMEGWTANQHATRLVAGSEVSSGYLYAWLSSDYGQRLLKRHSYGSVILEIDRDMIGAVPIPLPTRSVRYKVGDLVFRANELRDQAWRLERQTIEELECLIESGARRPAHQSKGLRRNGTRDSHKYESPGHHPGLKTGTERGLPNTSIIERP